MNLKKRSAAFSAVRSVCSLAVMKNRSVGSFDKKAVEEAIRIKEKTGSEVVVATMVPPSARDILNESLKMGADDAYLVTDR